MKIKFLLPGTTRTWHSGGIFIALKLARYLSELCPLEIVTYKDHESDHPYPSNTSDERVYWRRLG